MTNNITALLSNQVNNQSITITWRDIIHFDSEDDNRRSLETSVTVNRTMFAQTIISYPFLNYLYNETEKREKQ